MKAHLVGGIRSQMIMHSKTADRRVRPKTKCLGRRSPKLLAYRHQPIPDQHAHLTAMMRGHYAYYGITGIPFMDKPVRRTQPSSTR
jgi:hypothetical protein